MFRLATWPGKIGLLEILRVNPLKPKLDQEFLFVASVHFLKEVVGRVDKISRSKFILCNDVSNSHDSTLFYKALILQDKIWYWSFLGHKWLTNIQSNLRHLFTTAIFFRPGGQKLHPSTFFGPQGVRCREVQLYKL